MDSNETRIIKAVAYIDRAIYSTEFNLSRKGHYRKWHLQQTLIFLKNAKTLIKNRIKPKKIYKKMVEFYEH